MEKTIKPKLIGMTLEELQGVATRGKMPRFVGKQLAEWLYDKKAVSFDEMVNISKKNKEWLADNYEIGRTAPASASRSSDGTVKYLFKVANGCKIESVYIPDKDRATLCVSSQAGCKMNCYFCATGRMGFKSDLTAAEIINQILSVPPVTNQIVESGGNAFKPSFERQAHSDRGPDATHKPQLEQHHLRISII